MNPLDAQIVPKTAILGVLGLFEKTKVALENQGYGSASRRTAIRLGVGEKFLILHIKLKAGQHQALHILHSVVTAEEEFKSGRGGNGEKVSLSAALIASVKTVELSLCHLLLGLGLRRDGGGLDCCAVHSSHDVKPFVNVVILPCGLSLP